MVFILLSLVYGSAFAGNTQGLKYFSAGMYITFRMLFGAVTCLIILVIRMAANKEYGQIVRAHFTSVASFWWMALAGILFHGFPQCVIAIAQEWIASASVQLAQPLTTCTGAIFAHFTIPEERFTWIKGLSLLTALLGVALPAIPQFRRAEQDGSTLNLVIGYVLLIVGVVSFGIAAGLMKWKTPNVDVTVSTLIHTTMSTILCLIYALAWDKPPEIQKQCNDAPAIAWLWPIIVGVLGTGLAGHGFVLLVVWLGATGASFITVGQVLVGVILGVAALHEWKGYKVWEIVISVIGIVFLGASIGIGFYDPKNRVPQPIGEEEEERQNLERVGKDGNVVEMPEVVEEGYVDEHENEIVEL